MAEEEMEVNKERNSMDECNQFKGGKESTSVNVKTPVEYWRQAPKQLKNLTRDCRNRILNPPLNFLHMLDNDNLSDMTFFLGKDKVAIHAHKFILSLCSSNFENMTRFIAINGISPASFKSFLKFLYAEEFDVADEDLYSVLLQAKKFEIPLLMEKCVEEIMKSEIKVDTVVRIFQATRFLNDKSWAMEALIYILKNGSDIVLDGSFMSLSYTHLCLLFKRDDFEAEEGLIFLAACRWAVKKLQAKGMEECGENVRLCLKDAFKLIRFPLISVNDFADKIIHMKLLTDKEVISLLFQYSIPASERIELPLLDHGFCDRKRKFIQMKKPIKSIEPKKIEVDFLPRNGDWRIPRSGLKYNLMSLYEKGILTDVLFLVGPEQEELKAHRFILAIWSPIFETMLYGDGMNPIKGPIVLSDIDVESFKEFLRLLYTEHSVVTVENAMSVYLICRRYDITVLAEKCLSLLKNNIGGKNAVSIYQAAKEMNNESLGSSAWTYLINQGFSVVKETDFLNLHHSHLCSLLEHNDFNVEEIELFQATMRWAGHECEKRDLEKSSENLRSVLKNAISLIRFPLMTIKDFSLHVASTQILTEKEMLDICTYSSQSPSQRANSNKFSVSCKERKIHTGQIEEPMSVCNLSLKTDRSVSITGYSFVGMNVGKIMYAPTSICFYNSKKGLISTFYTETLGVDDEKNGYNVRFKTPIVVEPDQWYISTEITSGRPGVYPAERESLISIKSHQKEVYFEFQVHPIRDNSGGFEYAIPEMIFTLL